MPKGQSDNEWQLVFKDMSKEGVEESFNSNLHYSLAKDMYTQTLRDEYMALAIAIRDRIVERWISSQQGYHKKNVKRVYYLSLEFLIGRLFGTNILNLDLWNEVKAATEDLGIDLSHLREEEPDAGLGNGGLGRLAACFLDSMATLGIPCHGYGIRYDYGIFQQKIVNGYQVEVPDKWLKYGNPWEFARPEYSVKIRYGGETHMYYNREGRLCVEWLNTQAVVAMPYDIPVVGYKNDVVNTLRLWSARGSEEFDLQYFNHGDYERAVYDKMFSENISRVLYPSDASSQGRELRLKQEYFFTAASISDIIRRFKTENADFRDFPNKAAIQLNDTHPALAIIEFMRILIDDDQLDWDTAWDITVRTFAYTNHTVMPEALECWPVSLFEKLLPRHMQIVYELNWRFLREVANRYPGDNDRLARMSLIEEGNPKKIRMAHLSIVGSHSVNGVSELHSNLLKRELFRDFYEFFPEKFNNKTNGVTQRRWLNKANRSLSALITEAIGSGWTTDLYQMEKLDKFKKDREFIRKWQDCKRLSKEALGDYIFRTSGVRVNPESLFDVQVKRIHEYKRQLMFCFFILEQYLYLKNNPGTDFQPRTFILSGKAAPGYFMAKLIIKFANSIAGVINYDPTVRDKLKMVFLEDYRVSLAEKIFPASDLSEQISTAGTEASGTGCMKFLINGALTIGTHDGANIEMAQEVGYDNIFMFGMKVDEVNKLRVKGYNPRDFINQNAYLIEIFHLLASNFFCPMEPGVFRPIMDNLQYTDPFFVCADFESYASVQNSISENYRNAEDWTRKAIINVSKSGKFSSDRAIIEYAQDIWDVPYRKPKTAKPI